MPSRIMFDSERYASDLQVRYQALKKQNPTLRSRNAAQALGVSEGELLASRVGSDVIRLHDTPQEILESLMPLGEVMALTRNESAVHERKGIYENVKFFTHGQLKMGLVVNPDIDLRLFMNHWVYCFAEGEWTTQKRWKKSLQFFDKSGTAVHKIYLTCRSSESAYDDLITRFRSSEQPRILPIKSYATAQSDPPDSEVDWKAFREHWASLTDTHQFFPMLKKFKVGREQAFRNIGSDFAFPVSPHSLRHTLEQARNRECSIMIFVGNRGCLQIHTGLIKNLVEHGPWYNILDPLFNLHVREDHIASAWVTLKPTEDGHVSALELFDSAGGILVTLFGKRKPGEPELQEWRDILSTLEPLKR